MFINKKAQLLHIVRFRKGDLIYMTTTDDSEIAVKMLDNELRLGTFPNKEFQTAYELAKVEMGLLNPDPSDLVFHQFIFNEGQTGYLVGHWMIRDILARNDGLRNITNIGDWLDADGFIDVTPPDQDKRKFIRVTDIGKYYAQNNCFDAGVYPLYILSEENNQIQSSGLVETHRDAQPNRGGYDCAFYGDPPRLLDYNDVSVNLTDEQEQMIKDKPMYANGRLYSSVDQFARARNLPTWFVLEQITVDEGDLYVYATDWHFV
jgi:hypothetical protein